MRQLQFAQQQLEHLTAEKDEKAALLATLKQDERTSMDSMAEGKVDIDQIQQEQHQLSSSPSRKASNTPDVPDESKVTSQQQHQQSPSSAKKASCVTPKLAEQSESHALRQQQHLSSSPSANDISRETSKVTERIKAIKQEQKHKTAKTISFAMPEVSEQSKKASAPQCRGESDQVSPNTKKEKTETIRSILVCANNTKASGKGKRQNAKIKADLARLISCLESELENYQPPSSSGNNVGNKENDDATVKVGRSSSFRPKRPKVPSLQQRLLRRKQGKKKRAKRAAELQKK